MRSRHLFALAISVLGNVGLAVAETNVADVVVYGSSPAALTAAISARKAGRSAVIVCPETRIGGLTTGGLGQTDIGNKRAFGGLALAFYRDVAAHYRGKDAWKWQKRSDYLPDGQCAGTKGEDSMWTFEPSAALKILERWEKDHGLDIRRGEFLDRTKGGVTVADGRIAEIRTLSGNVYRGKMFVDATYEGDLMAAAGVSYVVGREANATYGEELDGTQVGNAKYHNFVDGVDPYVVKGDRSSGLLPGLESGQIEPDGTGDRRVQAYCFRMCLTDVPENRIPFAKPEGYDERDYELLFRNFEAGDVSDCPPWINSKMPNRKTDTNNRRGFSTDFIGQNWNWPEAGYAERAEILKAHLRYQRGLMWTLANHPRVPEAIRREVSRWGTCRDEFADGLGDGWQNQLYVREARRLVGDYVMTEANCRVLKVAERPVAMAAYTMDSHNVRRYVTAQGFVKNEGDVQVRGGRGPFGIDYGAIVPKRGECANLFVPVCLSASHIAFGSIRMEPVFFALGQAAGTAAALAIDAGCAVQDLAYPPLRARLLADGQVLEIGDRPGPAAKAAAEPIRVGIDPLGTFKLGEPGASLMLYVVEHPWVTRQLTLVGKERGENGRFAVAGELGGRVAAVKTAVKGEVLQSLLPDGAVKLTCSYSLDRDYDIRAAYLSAEFQLADFSAGKVTVNGKRTIPLSKELPTSIFHSKAERIAFSGADGREIISFAFPKRTLVHLQYNGKWGADTLSLRMGIGRETGKVRAGEEERLEVVMKGTRPYVLGPLPPFVTKEGDDWVRLPPAKPWIVPGSALDFSGAAWFDAPAGKHGRVVAKGQNFEFERLPGVPQRFLGVNLCFDANTPPEEASPRFAANLRRFGYNAIRFHHHDGALTAGSADGVSLNPEAMRKFDRLVAACIDEGLYLTTDLYVSRPVTWRQCGIDRDGGPADKSEFKEMVLVHEGCYSNFIAYARNFLSHVNPFTGRSYAKEPALGFLSFVNEGNPGNRGTVYFGNEAWRKAWTEWLSRRAAADERFRGIPDTVPASLKGEDRQTAAFLIFLKDVETRFATRVNRFLREEMGCDVLTTDQNGWTNPAANQLVRTTCYGYMDDHRYVDHPQFLGKSWQLPTACPNVNTLRYPWLGVLDLAQRRILTMPFTVSEFNYSVPGNFRGSGGLILGAQAALQNWAALWRFAWSHGVGGIVAPERKSLGSFDISGDPIMLASERAFMHLFLRRDLPELPESDTYALVLDGKRLDTELGRAVHLDDIDWRWAAWWRKIGTTAELLPGWQSAGSFPEAYGRRSDAVAKALFGGTGAFPSVAGGGKIALDRGQGMMTVATDRLCAGVIEEGKFSAGALTVEIGGAPATVCASTVDGAATLAASKRILVSHLTVVRNTGDVFDSDAARRTFKHGRLPLLMRRGTAKVALAVEAPETFAVWAIRPNGERKCRVPAEAKDGKLTFTADVARDRKEAVMLYELVRE